MVRLNGKPLKKLQKNENHITISGTHLNLEAIKEQKHLKADLPDTYFSHLPESQRTEASEQLWAALKGKEVVSTDTSPVIQPVSEEFKG